MFAEVVIVPVAAQGTVKICVFGVFATTKLLFNNPVLPVQFVKYTPLPTRSPWGFVVVTVATVPFNVMADVPAGIAAPVKKLPIDTYVFVASNSEAAGAIIVEYVKLVFGATPSTIHQPSAFAWSSVP